MPTRKISRESSKIDWEKSAGEACKGFDKIEAGKGFDYYNSKKLYLIKKRIREDKLKAFWETRHAKNHITLK